MRQSANTFDHLTSLEKQIAIEFVEKIRRRFDGQLISAIMFGSRARGEGGPDSDMDLAVVVTQASLEVRKAIRQIAVEVWLAHGIYVSTRVWGDTDWRRMAELQTSLYQNICQDGINLLECQLLLAG